MSRVRNLIGAVLVCGGLTLAGCGPAGQSPGTWASVARGEPLVSPAAVSCATDSFCLAVGGQAGAEGDERPASAVFDGSAWSPIAAPAARGGFVAVSCGAPTRCLALGRPADAATSFLATWDGAAWHLVDPAVAGPSPVTAVSCAGPTTCLAMADSPLLWDGGIWTRLTGPAGGTLSCGRPRFCVTADFRSFAPLTLGHWDGTNWTERALSVSGRAFGGALGLSCAGPDLCLLTGRLDELDTFDTDGALTASWNGTSWRGGVDSRPVGDYRRLPACAPGTDRCLVIHNDGTGTEVWEPGSGFTPVARAAAPVTELSCRPAWCLAVGPGTAARYRF